MKGISASVEITGRRDPAGLEPTPLAPGAAHLERWSAGAPDRERPISLDVVIPVFNESAVLEKLFERMESVFSPENLEIHGLSRVRFIFVDDGSTDETARIVVSRIASGVAAELYQLSRNFGHQNAVAAGIDASDSDVVSVMDADLQDPPELIIDMIHKWREGYEVVYAQRRKRKESRFKVACYWLFYRLISILSEVEVPVDSGDFCLMDRRVVTAIRSMPEKLRFQRGARAWVGFAQTGIQYERPARMAGQTKYTLRKLYRLATDGVAWLTVWPLKLAQLASAIFGLLTLILMILLGSRLLLGSPMDKVQSWFLLTQLLISSGFCILSVCLYVMSAYIGRTYIEAKHRPSYVIREHIHAEALHRAGVPEGPARE